MIRSLLLAGVLFTVMQLYAQTAPKIGSEKNVKEKLIRIKQSLPDFKKSLVKKDDTFVEEYVVKMEMGNGIILFSEEEDDQQTLTIKFSGPVYFSGSVSDFQQYYEKLSGLLKEIFDKTHSYSEKKENKNWTIQFFAKGKTPFTSPTLITLEVSWIFPDSPHISLDFLTYPKGKLPEADSD